MIAVGNLIVLSAPMIVIVSRRQERPDKIITINNMSLAVSAEGLALTIRL